MQPKLHLDFTCRCELGAGMDNDDADLLTALCTRIGICMEDACGVALRMGRLDGTARAQALLELQTAVRQIEGLFGAVRVLSG